MRRFVVPLIAVAVLLALASPVRAQTLALPATVQDTLYVGTSVIVRPIVRDVLGRPTSVSRVVAVSADTTVVAISYVSGGQRLTPKRAGEVRIVWLWDRTDGRRLFVSYEVRVVARETPPPPPDDNPPPVDTVVAPPVDTVVTPPPPPPPPPGRTTLRDSILALMGPTLTVPQTVAKGGAYAQYESRFRFWADSQWKMYGFDWATANYYDRAAIYYTWWARGASVPNDTVRARLLAVDYRTWLEGITNPRAYATSPRNSQLEGLALDWWVRRDSASRKAVLRTADELWLTTQSVFQYIDTIGGRTAWEPRIQARILLAQWLGEQIDGANPKWATRVDNLVPRILSTQSADGAWRPHSACDESLNYMSGMLLDVLARVHDNGHASTALATAIVRGATWLWGNEWLASQAVFRYMPISCAGVGGPNPAPDVAGLMAPIYGWMARRDPAVWAPRAALALAATRNAYLYGSKQFNETFNGSYRAILP